MGTLLTASDEDLHPAGNALNWNESRYVDFYDPEQGVGGWLRIGMRPNEHYAEMSVCVYLPDGTTAFAFERVGIDANGLTAGGQQWVVQDPFVRGQVRFDGALMLLTDPWQLTDPGRVYREAPRLPAALDLATTSAGITAVMGHDQADIDRIFLPGQADFHYQHLARTTGDISVGIQHWQVNGVGGRDHSWGPRNWHAKTYLRWLICSIDDDNGFMLVRAVGPTKSTRSGHLLMDGKFHLVHDFAMRNTYAGPPNYELQRVEVTIEAGGRSWHATGEPQTWLPLRHRQQQADGGQATLRIVKSAVVWELADSRKGAGHCEYHDVMDDRIPIGLAD